jgi:hypothetical protein
MCFSAQASFIVGTGLTLFGAHLLKSALYKKEQYFKTIPLMFGVQQIAEGFVWLSQTNPNFTVYGCYFKSVFLFFAFIVWPIWVPYSLLQIESNQAKKRCLASILGAGTVVSTTLAWLCYTFGVQTAITCNHIEYALAIPIELRYACVTWYCIATLSPFFIVRKKFMQEFGLLLLVSAILSAYFYTAWFTSVWCFFAALLSFMIYKIK